LESEGFEVQCFLIPASGIGAWHQRYRVWIVGHSQHNGSLASKIKRRDIETATRTQEGKNETSEPTRAGGSRNDEDVSNAKRQRLEGHVEYGSTIDRKNERTQSGSTDSSRSAKNISNTNTRLSIGENEEVQTRRDTVDSSSSRGREENVSNTEIIGTRESRNIDQEKRNESSGSTQSDGSGKDVSNTISSLRGGGRTIGQSGKDKVWRFYFEEEEQARVDIRSETIGRDALFRETENVTNTISQRTTIPTKGRYSSIEMSGGDGKKRRNKHVLQSNNERQQKSNISKESEKQNISDWGYDTDETKQTWWQTESNLCGVPNGISYELDKDRANRIKTLGNAIVPQIARELGLAIKKVVSEDII
jgi:hypothetical protein